MDDVREAELRARIAALEEELADNRRAGSLRGWRLDSVAEIIDSLPMLVYTKDAEDRFVRVNETLANRLGMRPDDLAGVHCGERFPDLERHCGTIDREVMRTGVPILGQEFLLEFPAGPAWIIASKLPMRDRDGKVGGLVSVGFDISSQKSVESRLRTSEARFRSIFENAGIGMADLSIDGVYRHANAAFCQIMGMREDEIIGRHFRELTFSEDLPNLERQAARLVRGEIISLTTEKRNVRGDGSLVWVRTIDTLIFDSEGAPTGFITLLQDISNRKLIEAALEESMETARAVLNAVTESAVLIDPDGMVIEANETLAHRVGVTPAVMRGKCLFDFFPADVAKTRHARMRKLVAEPATPSMRFIDQREGRWVENIVFPIRNQQGQVRRLVVLGFDITERIESEQRLVSLADDLAARTGELEQANQRLQASNRDLESFAYTVSHDLKSPLELMKSCLSIVLDDHGDIIDPQVRDLLSRATEAGSRMQDLISDLLWFSRSNSMELRRDEVNLSWLAGDVAARLLFRLGPGRPEVVIQEGLTAHADEALMRVALENLIGNACKFSGRKPNARVEIGAAGNGADRVFFVRDNGIGFEQSQAERLFEPFFRLHNRTEYEGSGIGLATVARIIERHGGRIWAEGNQGVGAVFLFTLGE